MSRKWILRSLILGSLVAGILMAVPYIDFYMLTGRFTPINRIETLQNSVAVIRWNSEGLLLADGRTVQLPGLRSLPVSSAALTEATKRGIELDANGRVWALVRIHHWCGNDPVREHIARIDLAYMMMFLRVGEPTTRVPEVDFLTAEPGGRFTKWGWNVSEYWHFRSWLQVEASSH